MRVYISGPITGTDDYMERFAGAEEELTAAGYQVYNPAHANSYMPEGTTYEEYMEVSFTLLKMADVIYMLDGWEQSRGAKMEYAYALGMGYKVMQQEDTGYTPEKIQECNALCLEKCQEVNVLRKRMQWIPVTWHNTTEDDGIDMQKYLICFDCPMPEEDQEILVCDKNGNIWLDTCCFYDGYVLDSGNDWIDDISAWMPLPEPYREEGEAG